MIRLWYGGPGHQSIHSFWPLFLSTQTTWPPTLDCQIALPCLHVYQHRIDAQYPNVCIPNTSHPIYLDRLTSIPQTWPSNQVLHAMYCQTFNFKVIYRQWMEFCESFICDMKDLGRPQFFNIEQCKNKFGPPERYTICVVFTKGDGGSSPIPLCSWWQMYEKSQSATHEGCIYNLLVEKDVFERRLVKRIYLQWTHYRSKWRQSLHCWRERWMTRGTLSCCLGEGGDCLSPKLFVVKNVCRQDCLSSKFFVAKHVCCQTCLLPEYFVVKIVFHQSCFLVEFLSSVLGSHFINTNSESCWNNFLHCTAL